MFDLEDLLESAEIGGKGSPKMQARFRVLFGILGTGLAVVGAYHTLFFEAGLPFRLAGVALFLSLGCFCAFNIVLHRAWTWPGRLFIVSLVALFVVRIVFGA